MARAAAASKRPVGTERASRRMPRRPESLLGMRAALQDQRARGPDLVAHQQGDLAIEHVEPLVGPGVLVRAGAGSLRQQLLHQREPAAGVVAVREDQPQDVRHPVGGRRVGVADERD